MDRRGVSDPKTRLNGRNLSPSGVILGGRAGPTVPLTDFGYALSEGAKKAVGEQGLLRAFTGGITATAGGIAAAILFGYLFALFARPKTKL